MQIKKYFSVMTILLILSLLVLAGCDSSSEDIEEIDYTPRQSDDSEATTPEEQGLDPVLVEELYLNASELETLYGLIVVKNNHIIAEKYFNEGDVDKKSSLASVTKSYVSGLVGVALDQGYLSSVDQKMIDFFPEFVGQINDNRKNEITIRDMLQMRSGYPWEEKVSPYLDLIFSDPNWLPFIVEFPLTSDPGTEFGYSNLTSHLLAIIVARATDTDLKSYGQENLFSPIDAEVGDWWQDANDYYLGSGLISFSARDAAKFGMLYLNNGKYMEDQVLSSSWIEESLQRYSENIKFPGEIRSKLGSYFRDIGYGYQWWSATVGDHDFYFAWGHGGNLIVLLDELDMVIVTTADDLHGIFGGESWKHEGAIINLVGEFIKSLPSE